MSVRAKMILSSITAHSWSADSKTLKFSTQYDGTIPAAIAQFALGKAYYVDFTEA
jgi:hypothetical protein